MKFFARLRNCLAVEFQDRVEKCPSRSAGGYKLPAMDVGKPHISDTDMNILEWLCELVWPMISRFPSKSLLTVSCLA